MQFQYLFLLRLRLFDLPNSSIIHIVKCSRPAAVVVEGRSPASGNVWRGMLVTLMCGVDDADLWCR